MLTARSALMHNLETFFVFIYTRMQKSQSLFRFVHVHAHFKVFPKETKLIAGSKFGERAKCILGCVCLFGCCFRPAFVHVLKAPDMENRESMQMLPDSTPCSRLAPESSCELVLQLFKRARSHTCARFSPADRGEKIRISLIREREMGQRMARHLYKICERLAGRLMRAGPLRRKNKQRDFERTRSMRTSRNKFEEGAV